MLDCRAPGWVVLGSQRCAKIFEGVLIQVLALPAEGEVVVQQSGAGGVGMAVVEVVEFAEIEFGGLRIVDGGAGGIAELN